MVLVKSSMIRSKQPLVQVNIKGINQVIERLRRVGVTISNSTELELTRQGNFIQQEVQESIIGNRAEPRSVDTGEFANSIELSTDFLTQNKSIVVFSVIPYARYLEYGTSRMAPRRHFRNTIARNKMKVIKALQRQINIKFKISGV